MNRLIYFFALIVSIIVFGLTPIFGQVSKFKPQVHEISLQMIEINHMPSYHNYYLNDLPASLNYFNGLRYTFHLNTKNAFRFGGFYRKSKFELTGIPFTYRGYETNRLSKKNVDLQLGYIYKIPYKSSRIHLGIEGRMGFGSLEEFKKTEISLSQTAEPFSYRNFGANLVMGYSYFFNTRTSLGLEVSTYFTKIDNKNNAITDIQPRSIFVIDELGANLSIFLSFHL